MINRPLHTFTQVSYKVAVGGQFLVEDMEGVLGNC